MGAKHTPGPFDISGTDRGPGERHLHIGAASSVTALASMNPSHPDTLANADLFRAAPDTAITDNVDLVANRIDNFGQLIEG